MSNSLKTIKRDAMQAAAPIRIDSNTIAESQISTPKRPASRLSISQLPTIATNGLALPQAIIAAATHSASACRKPTGPSLVFWHYTQPPPPHPLQRAPTVSTCPPSQARFCACQYLEEHQRLGIPAALLHDAHNAVEPCSVVRMENASIILADEKAVLRAYVNADSFTISPSTLRHFPGSSFYGMPTPREELTTKLQAMSAHSLRMY
ncbi:hypothetical protein [Pseudomonas donghuensis]|uniref:hypothetical protein n=1 Tax=Pseudomonas donghuensis TaxID=1163398 RepID=UPI0021606165|nr:hypothetical protein [Pseudomonas donghuensis]UVL23045.1 hypothetical protein LOY30_19715 [Pseudomonas donghuensis]